MHTHTHTIMLHLLTSDLRVTQPKSCTRSVIYNKLIWEKREKEREKEGGRETEREMRGQSLDVTRVKQIWPDVVEQRQSDNK